MQHVRLFIFVIIATLLITSVFGIVHDQITYTISNEYYTRFKFIQFGLVPKGMELQMPHRIAALIVGIKATWWTGIPIGLIYGSILFSLKYTPLLYKIYFKTIGLTFIITIFTGVAGYLYWKLNLQYTEVNWYLPDNLIDKNSFICVGSIHNFSYLGGVIGLMAGSLYLVLQKERLKVSRRNFKIP